MVFASNGNALICSLKSSNTDKSYVQVYRFSTSSKELLPTYTQFHLVPSIEGLVTISTVGSMLLTVSTIPKDSSFAIPDRESTVAYEVALWSYVTTPNPMEPPKLIQSVKFELPKTIPKASAAAGHNLLQLPFMEVTTRVELKRGQQRYVILSSR